MTTTLRSRRNLTRALAVLLATASMPTLAGGSYSMPWFRLTSGGGVSSGGAYSLAGSIAPTDAGTTGSNGVALHTPDGTALTQYQLVSGFSAFVVQSTAAADTTPQLKFAASGSSGTFSWTATGSGGTLQQSASLGPDAEWIDVEAPVTTNGTTRSVQLPSPDGSSAMFFRLRQ